MSFARLRFCLLLSFVFAITSATAIFVVPLANFDGSVQQQSWSYFVAGLFWLCLFGQIITVRLTTISRKSLQKGKLRRCKFEALPIGLFAFRQNVEGLIVDTLLVISFLALVIVTIFKARPIWLTIAPVAAGILLFQLHRIFNGRNYRAYKVYLFMNKGAKEK